MKLCHFGMSCLFLSMATPAFADTWTSLTPTTCPTSSSGLFTTGQQYVDANNGVLQNSWSMLVRWQDKNKTVGNTNWISSPLNYNAGIYTTYTPPVPYSTWQRGYQQESQASATPGVQLHGCDAGMIINTWQTPHAGDPFGATTAERTGIVPGGEFNDMYGYAWASANRPYAFKQLINGSYVQSDLVLQGLLAVPAVQTYEGTFANNAWSYTPVADVNDLSTFSGSAQLAFFAYIQDTSHPNLHPIALIASVYGNGPSGNFACPAEGTGGIVQGPDYPGGVYFGSTGICTTDISTRHYTGGVTSNALSSNLTFYRIHYTASNLAALVNRINALQPNCLAFNSCYSIDANVYTVQYIGVIAEAAPCTHVVKNNKLVTHCSTNLRDPSQDDYLPNKDAQIGMAAKASGVSAYAYTAN
jgi:hypothetical protein